jgi:hypothetical protein
MDTKPYRFERMTGAEFSAALNRVGLTAGEFRRLTGASPKKVEGWLSGIEDIPPWVPPFLAMAMLPAALHVARAEAARRLADT